MLLRRGFVLSVGACLGKFMMYAEEASMVMILTDFLSIRLAFIQNGNRTPSVSFRNSLTAHKNVSSHITVGTNMRTVSRFNIYVVLTCLLTGAVCIYFGIVFYVPGILEQFQALKLRGPFAVWNLGLAVFSVVGMSRTVPHLVHALRTDGFTSTVCKDPKDWYLDGPVGLWVGLFIFSKIPELGDTVFLVLQKKRVIFLHWFHHVTVMLYCWHAYHNRVASGLWFTAMNLTVHSIMYTYYFLMAARLHYLATPFAPLITTIQILQMAVGSYVTWHSASVYTREGPSSCAVNPANFKLGLAMYGCYFWLFCLLFHNKYFGQGTRQQRGTAGGGEGSDKICGVDIGTSKVDMAGRFADFNTANAPRSRDAPGVLTRSQALANGKHD